MLAIILKIVSIIGIVLLVILGIALLLLLLILFYPITYRVFGKKDTESISAWIKINWLFGLFRVRYAYPEPGKLTVKALWVTLFDSSKPKEKDSEAKKDDGKIEKTQSTTTDFQASPLNTEAINTQGIPSEAVKPEADNSEKGNFRAGNWEAGNSEEGNSRAGNSGVGNPGADNSASGNPESIAPDAASTDNPEEGTFEPKSEANANSTFLQRIMAKCEKIKYTIHKIYDKIKHIADNIAFYKELLQEEETRGLFQHAWFRLGRIWKNVHPRKLRGDILFGTGSPDTTGYAFGVYGMLSPKLGRHFQVTPDFTQTVLEGEIYAAGHITLFQIGMHTIILLLDKRLRLLFHKIKTHNKQNVEMR